MPRPPLLEPMPIHEQALRFGRHIAGDFGEGLVSSVKESSPLLRDWSSSSGQWATMKGVADRDCRRTSSYRISAYRSMWHSLLAHLATRNQLSE